MKYYLKPQNSIHFKNQLIEIYKMVWFLRFTNFYKNFPVVLKISIQFFSKITLFWDHRKITTFFINIHRMIGKVYKSKKVCVIVRHSEDIKFVIATHISSFFFFCFRFNFDIWIITFFLTRITLFLFYHTFIIFSINSPLPIYIFIYLT